MATKYRINNSSDFYVNHKRQPSWGQSVHDPFWAVAIFSLLAAAIGAFACLILTMAMVMPFVGDGEEFNPFAKWSSITGAILGAVITFVVFHFLPKYVWPRIEFDSTRQAEVYRINREQSPEVQQQLAPIYKAIMASDSSSPDLWKLTDMFAESVDLLKASEDQHRAEALAPQIDEATSTYNAIREIYGSE